MTSYKLVMPGDLNHYGFLFGGNASSEIRMWISGAGTRVRNLQETGIMEEIALDNMARNPSRNWSLWDALLYEKVRFEPNIDLILNCACSEAEVEGNDQPLGGSGRHPPSLPGGAPRRRIVSVTGFQSTTQQRHAVRAKIFADCSGDSILAPLTGASIRAASTMTRRFCANSSAASWTTTASCPA